MSVQEIEKAIIQLSIQDKHIEEDLKTGRLDALLAEVDAEYEAGLSRLL
jgi:hypothetical protein